MRKFPKISFSRVLAPKQNDHQSRQEIIVFNVSGVQIGVRHPPPPSVFARTSLRDDPLYFYLEQ